MASPAMFDRRDVWLAAILVLAFLLRLPYATQPLVDWFTWREASTAMLADNLPANGWNPLWPQVSWTGDQPGYQGREFQVLTFAAALLDHVLGWRDWHGRAVALCCGLASLLFLYLFVRRLYGRADAQAAALMLAVLPGAVVVDTSYLPDPAMLALLTLAFWLLAAALQDRRNLLLLAACLAGTLAVLAKLPAVGSLPAALYLVFALRGSRDAREIATVAAIVVACAVPVLAYYRWAVYLGSTYPPFHIAGSGYVWDDGFRAFLDNGWYVRTAWKHVRDWLWGWPVLVFLAVGAFARPPQAAGGSARPAPLLFEIWLAGACVIYLMAARELTDNPWNFTIFAAPVAALAGRGLRVVMAASRITSTIRAAATSLLLVAVLCLSARAGSGLVKYTYTADDDRELGLELGRLSAPGDLVVVSGTRAGTPLPIYYSRHKGWVFPPPPEQENFMIYTDDGAASVHLLETLKGRGAKWFGFVKQGNDFSEPPRLFREHYSQLIRHLDETAERAAETESYVIFRLPP